MSLINWSFEKYGVEIVQMDSEHQKLVDIINELSKAMQDGKANDVISKILKELEDYSITHFKHEEDILKKQNYPGIAEQVEQHNKFIETIKGYEEDLKAGKIMLSVKILNFLGNWLLNHIKVVDKKYSAFLKEKGVK